jgi:hypothetical protein
MIYWGRLILRAESSLIQSNCRSFIGVIVPYEISKEKKILRFVNTGLRVTHSTNEDLLNIKRKGDPEVSYPLSYV